MGIIYCIHCLTTGKKYIGQTMTSLSKRIRYHRYDVDNGSKCKLHQSIRLYGWDNHIYGVVEETDLLNEQECYYIFLFDTLNDGLNSAPGGGKFPRLIGEQHPLHGVGHSEETKKKIKDNHHNVSGKNNPMFGRIHSEETKQKISQALKGDESRLWSQERKDIHALKVSDDYILTFSDGTSIQISNLKKWARDNGFNYGSLCNILHNKTKQRFGKNKLIKSITKLS